MASLTVEKYVKAIYQLTGGEENHATSTSELATALKVTPGTVKVQALKTLKEMVK